MNTLHHATLVHHSPVQAFQLAVFGELPEVEELSLEVFGIDDVRKLVQTAHQRPNDSAVKTLVVRTDFITHEAQNALLKILEEPPESTRFVFILPVGFQLLPTLRSRFAFHDQVGSDADEAEQQLVFNTFLSSTYQERLAQIEAMLKEKNIVWQQGVKQGVMHYAQQCSSAELTDIEFVARHLLTRGASNKMLMEHLALSLPTRSA